MKAALLFGLQDLRLIEIPKPALKPKSVLLKVRACGICPTDIKKYHTIYSGNLKLPENLGHEYIGTVIDIANDVENFEIGMRVMGDGPGGYAEYALLDLTLEPPVHLPAPIIVPENVSDPVATFIEPLSCCVHAVQDQASVLPSETVLVVGGGTMGLLNLMVLKSIGARVILSEPYEFRRQMALSLGADAVINPANQDLVSSVKGINNGAGVDAVILAIGNPSSVQECLDVVRPSGRVVLFGRFPHGSKINIDPIRLYREEVRLSGSYWIGGDPKYARVDAFHRALHLLSNNKVPVEKIISGTYPLNQIHKALNEAQSMDTFKIIVTPE